MLTLRPTSANCSSRQPPTRFFSFTYAERFSCSEANHISGSSVYKSALTKKVDQISFTSSFICFLSHNSWKRKNKQESQQPLIPFYFISQKKKTFLMSKQDYRLQKLFVAFYSIFFIHSFHSMISIIIFISKYNSWEFPTYYAWVLIALQDESALRLNFKESKNDKLIELKIMSNSHVTNYLHLLFKAFRINRDWITCNSAE